MGLFCESVSVAASMAAPDDEKVLSESTTTEEFTNTLASWLRFSLCSCSHFLNYSSSVTTQHNKQQQRENLLGKAGLQPLPAIVPSLARVRSFRGLLRSRGKLLASAHERSLCSLSQFSNDTGRRSRLLHNTQKETFPLLMYFFCVVFFVVVVVVVFRLSTPRDRQINEIFPFSTKFF